MEEIICKLGTWYEIAGVFVCCTDQSINGVRVKVSATEPRAKVKRRKALASAPPTSLQLPVHDSIPQTGHTTM